jgi:hypothetical protein
MFRPYIFPWCCLTNIVLRRTFLHVVVCGTDDGWFRAGTKICCSSELPDWVWVPFSLPFEECQRLFVGVKPGRGFKWNTHHLVQRLRMHGATPPCLVLKSTGTTPSFSSPVHVFISYPYILLEPFSVMHSVCVLLREQISHRYEIISAL